MRFTKMHALGNDYIYVDCIRQTPPADPAALSVALSRPHTGIGADGLILILPSPVADARMRIYNADGSEALMCGNGIRCVGKFLYDSGLCKKETIRVETQSGIKLLRMQIKDGVAAGASVDMDPPRFDAASVPVLCEDAQALRLEAAGHTFLLHCVSIGNPHAVCFSEPGDALFYAAGPVLENHPVFPARANIEFCTVLNEHELRMRVWERGSGETMACGTGATACAVQAIRMGLCQSPVTVHLAGGDLRIDWDGTSSAFMTGPAHAVFSGEWPAIFG